MKVSTSEIKPSFEVIGNRVIAYLSIDETIVSGEEDNQTESYVYSCAEWQVQDTNDAVIEAVIRSRYPTYGAEIAALSDEVRATEHAAFRIYAKAVASAWQTGGEIPEPV